MPSIQGRDRLHLTTSPIVTHSSEVGLEILIHFRTACACTLMHVEQMRRALFVSHETLGTGN